MKRYRMQYREFDPAAELRPWVANYWSLRVSPSAGPVTHVVPPDGCVNIVCSAHRVLVLGPQTAPLSPPVRAGDQWFGARLRPGAARNLLGIPSALKLHNAIVMAAHEPSLSWLCTLPDRLNATCSDDDRRRVMHELLLPRLESATEPDEVVMRSIDSILGAEPGLTIAALAGELGLSARQLHRRFVRAVDLSPSEFRAIWRLRRCLVEMVATPGSRWSMRAASNGYSDQSHLTREFRRLIGLSPKRFAHQTSTIFHDELRFPEPNRLRHDD